LRAWCCCSFVYREYFLFSAFFDSNCSDLCVLFTHSYNICRAVTYCHQSLLFHPFAIVDVATHSLVVSLRPNSDSCAVAPLSKREQWFRMLFFMVSGFRKSSIFSMTVYPASRATCLPTVWTNTTTLVRHCESRGLAWQGVHPPVIADLCRVDRPSAKEYVVRT